MYQPIVEAQSGDIASFEALIRLRDHNISPYEFIRVAEEKGLIIDIGRWVLKTAVCQLYEWKKNGTSIRPIAVNLSPKQIKDSDLLEFLQALLMEYDIEPQFLQIEITEDVLIEDSKEAITFLEKLKSVGFKISLDDFGSGYSSLTYLTFMPIDKVKLDKSLIDKYLNSDYASIIQNIIRIAHDLKLLVVAEGVELQEQCELLKEIDCDYIQGYFFSRPVDPDVAEKMM